jgi:hypothetical protein
MSTCLTRIHTTYNKIIRSIEKDHKIRNGKIHLTLAAKQYLDKLIWFVYHELNHMAWLKNLMVDANFLRNFLSIGTDTYPEIRKIKFFTEENHIYFMQDCTNIHLPDESSTEDFMWFIENMITRILEECIEKYGVIGYGSIEKYNGYINRTNFFWFRPEDLSLPEFIHEESYQIKVPNKMFNVQIPNLKSLGIIVV